MPPIVLIKTMGGKKKLMSLLVSYFPRINSKSPKDVDFELIYSQHLNNEEHVKVNDKISRTINKTERDNLKQELLPVVSPGATFKEGSSAKEIKFKNSSFLIDIDLRDENEAELCKQILIKHVGVFCHFIGLSPSKRGLHLIIEGYSVKHLQGHINAFYEFLSTFFSINADLKCKDAYTRKMYLGCDKSAMFNGSPIPWPLIKIGDKYKSPLKGREKLVTITPALPIILTSKIIQDD